MYQRTLKCKIKWNWKLMKWRPMYAHEHGLGELFNCTVLCDEMNGVFRETRIKY